MDKVYDQKGVEEKIYKIWEEKGYFSTSINKNGKEYSIILPPPNANAPLHFGHAMYVLEDILIRFKRMQGRKALWLPGADHAGFETQFVFEKKLQSEGKSRFDYDRETLYEMIWEFVQGNRPIMEGQLRRLGFSLDWSKKKFTLDKDIVNIVYKTFKQLFEDGLVYRAKRLVNYCTFDGTSFSDLEVVYEERQNPLYYIKYGPLVLATTRPETKFGDTAIAVHPEDKRYQSYIGKMLDIETVLGKAKIKVIADKMVDPLFGTGVVKITPAHDFDDYEVSLRHNLPMVQVIDLNGKMNEKAGKFSGMYAKQARKLIVEEMQQKGLIEKIDENYKHRIGLCYKCKNPIEPLPLEQWFIKMQPLAKPALEVVRKKIISIYPQNMEKLYLQFLENIKDWNISRQIVWGIRIPAWRCKDCGKWIVTQGETPVSCKGECTCKCLNLIQDEDTFDTWFSSGQWPYATLKTTNSLEYYPTTVMETGYDILRWWVARMVILGLYMQKKYEAEDERKQIPFQMVVLHGLVNDPLGKKMSKSKGNAINPLELVDQYGADAVRFALVYGIALGNDQSLSYPKLDAMRKFTNKLWNMARFIDMNQANDSKLIIQTINLKSLDQSKMDENDKIIIGKTKNLVNEVTRLLDNYDFNHAAQNLYTFTWHTFADIYIEDVKNRINQNSYSVLTSQYLILLKLLHPFMPFVTEEIYKRLWKSEDYLIVSNWPDYENNK
jgi:valyl-tRNA synthetase